MKDDGSFRLGVALCNIGCYKPLMNGKELKTAGEELFGPKWRTLLALCLGVHRTQLWRWANKNAVPELAASMIMIFLAEKRKGAQKMNEVSPITKRWMEQNAEWFMKPGCEAKTDMVFAIHNVAIAAGVSPHDPEYARRLDTGLQAVYPEHVALSAKAV